MKKVFLAGLVIGSILMAHGAYAEPEYQIVQLGLNDTLHSLPLGYTDPTNELIASNQLGQVLGIANRYVDGRNLGYNSWLYNGSRTVEIGLNDAAHTSSAGYQWIYAEHLNRAGQAAGYAHRYNGATNAGWSAWFYNGTASIEVGLQDAVHTRVDGYQFNNVQSLNDAGQILGGASRFNSTNIGETNIGRSAWIYNGSSSVEIGLTDSEHTRSVDGYQNNDAWSLNQAGQVAGDARRYSGITDIGKSAWFYNGRTSVKIGLTDAAHTNSANSGYQFNGVEFLNQAGQVAGYASRFNSSVSTGTSAWLYNGFNTIEIGLTDVEHTRSTDGYQGNSAVVLNDVGQVAGYAQRFSENASAGISAWLYDGNSSVKIGLTDTTHTRASDGYQYNSVLFLNQSGQVVGEAQRFTTSYGNSGNSVWFYNGISSFEIGLTDKAHTSSDGVQYNSVNSLNEAGQISGNAARFIGTDIGQSAWLYNGTESLEIGQTDSLHTRSTDGYQENGTLFLNESGQVAGYAARFNDATDAGFNAWLYDSVLDQTYDLTFSVRGSDGYAFSEIGYLGHDGITLGRYALFDDTGVSLGDHAFYYSISEGFYDLGGLVSNMDEDGWLSLASVIQANGAGNFIVGDGLRNDGKTGLYLLSAQPSAVPVPAAMWLFGSGLVVIFGFVQRKKVTS